MSAESTRRMICLARRSPAMSASGATGPRITETGKCFAITNIINALYSLFHCPGMLGMWSVDGCFLSSAGGPGANEQSRMALSVSWAGSRRQKIRRAASEPRSLAVLNSTAAMAAKIQPDNLIITCPPSGLLFLPAVSGLLKPVVQPTRRSRICGGSGCLHPQDQCL